jgi:hypothetical protein
MLTLIPKLSEQELNALIPEIFVLRNQEPSEMELLIKL